MNAPFVGASDDPIYDDEAEVRARSWPKLKRLYFDVIDKELLSYLGPLDDLRMIKLREYGNQSVADSDQAPFANAFWPELAKCTGLVSLVISFGPLLPLRMLVSFVQGFPRLRYLHLSLFDMARGIGTDGLLEILQALPHLELLKIRTMFHIDTKQFGTIARCCPRLRGLFLSVSKLELLTESLADIPALRHLEWMHFGYLNFGATTGRVGHDASEGLIEEWRRIFPLLKACPINNDIANWGSRDLDVDIDDETPEGEEESTAQRNGTGSAAHQQRVRLWKALGYHDNPGYHPNTDFEYNPTLLGPTPTEYVWNLEAETVGWPVFSASTFLQYPRRSRQSRGSHPKPLWTVSGRSG